MIDKTPTPHCRKNAALSHFLVYGIIFLLLLKLNMPSTNLQERENEQLHLKCQPKVQAEFRVSGILYTAGLLNDIETVQVVTQFFCKRMHHSRRLKLVKVLTVG